MSDYYITSKDRTELLREIKNFIKIIQEEKEYDFKLLSDLEIEEVKEKVKETALLLDSFKQIQRNRNSSRGSNLNLLKRLATIFKYEDVDLNNLESLTDGQIWMHIEKLKKIQNYRSHYYWNNENMKKLQIKLK